MKITPVQISKGENAINWGLITLLFIEWFTSFFFIVINFFNFDHLLPLDSFLIFAIIFAPIWVLLINLTSKKYGTTLSKIASIGTPILCVSIGIISYLAFIALFQLEPWSYREPLGLNLENAILILLGKERRLVSWLLFSVNGLLFYGLTPMLLIKIKGKSSTFKNQPLEGLPGGLIIAALYMALRYGTISGISFRLMLLMAGYLTVYTFLWLLRINNSASLIHEGDAMEKEKVKHVPEISGIKWYLIGFSLSMPTMSANGLILNNWVWLCLPCGILISIGLNKYLKKDHGNMVERILIILYGLSSFGLILPQISGTFLISQPFFIAINHLFLGSWIYLALRGKSVDISIDKDKRILKILRNVGRSIMGLVGFLMPFLVGIQDPFSSWIMLIVNFALYVVLIVQILKKKNL